MSYIGKTYRHLNGDRVLITDIDFLTNSYIGKNVLSGCVEVIAGETIHSGIWVECFAARCECGTSITLGKEDHPMFHSADYCPVYRKGD